MAPVTRYGALSGLPLPRERNVGANEENFERALFGIATVKLRAVRRRETLKFVDPAQVPGILRVQDTLAYDALYYWLALSARRSTANTSLAALWGSWLTNAEEHRRDDMNGCGVRPWHD